MLDILGGIDKFLEKSIHLPRKSTFRLGRDMLVVNGSDPTPKWLLVWGMDRTGTSKLIPFFSLVI
jgi:hypothetical protein